VNVIDEIKSRLSKYPNVRYESTASSISVLPTSDSGFEVGLEVDRDTFTVFFDGWHEVFDNEAEALNCLAFGLSDECRLKEYRRGSFAYKWTIESLEDGKWLERGTTGLFIFPFWKEPQIRYLQNDLITGSG